MRTTGVNSMLLMSVFVVAFMWSSFASAQLESGDAGSLVEALASDDIPMNATRALETLLATNSPEIVRLLEAALDSKDYQQRQMAAGVLRHHTEEKPSKRLIEVTIEGLRDDHLPWDDRMPGRETLTYPYNAADGVRFLVKHGKIAQGELLGGLDSDDYQQRFLSAYALGMNGITNRLKDTIAILVFHLRDNEIRQDACMSCAAIYRLGPSVKPFLLGALDSADRQQAEAIRLLLLDLETPPHGERDLRARRRMQHISEVVNDPALEYDWASCEFPRGHSVVESP